MAVIDFIDVDLVPCVCGDLKGDHAPGVFRPCGVGGCGCEDFATDEAAAFEFASELGSFHVSGEVTLAETAAWAGKSPDLWPGKCTEIADALLRGAHAAGRLEGARTVFGHYRGFNHPLGFFGRLAHLSFVQHGWVELADGTVLDPTRWVFENVTPYIYQGPAADYDEGGNVDRAEQQRPCPPRTARADVQCGSTTCGKCGRSDFRSPKALRAHRGARGNCTGNASNVGERTLTVSAACADMLESLSGRVLTPTVSGTDVSVAMGTPQLFWVANLALPVLGEHAHEVFTALAEVDALALIPYDNRLKVLGS